MQKIINQSVKYESEGNRIFRVTNQKIEVDYKQLYEEHNGIKQQIKKIETDVKVLEGQKTEIPEKIANAGKQKGELLGRLKDTKTLYPRAEEILKSKFKTIVSDIKAEALESIKEGKKDPAQSNESWNYERLGRVRHFIMTNKKIADSIPQPIVTELLVQSTDLLSLEDVKD